MRVRTFELRLIAVTLAVLWAVAAGLVLLGYRPGGPIDLLVGVAACLTIPVAVVGLLWPPAARGDRAFAAIAWLGLGAGLVLVPSIGGLLSRLGARGPQTLLPSLEVAYPWLLAFAATSLFAGLGLARRLLGGAALRRDRLLRGAAFATVTTSTVALAFAGAAIANDLALRDTPAAASRFGPTNTDVDPPRCGGNLRAGTDSQFTLTIDGDVDRRPIGGATVTGQRSALDVRWTADVATDRALGRFGVARVGERAWTLEPGRSWKEVAPAAVADQAVDLQVVGNALSRADRIAAEELGLEYVEGARARHCRIATDGPTFLAAVPQARWLAGDADLHRWRGQLDYWIFVDGELGRADGSINGEASAIGLDGLLGTIRVTMVAVDRDRLALIEPPGR